MKNIKRVAEIKKIRQKCDCLAEGIYKDCLSNSRFKTEKNHSISKSKLNEIATKKRVLVFDIEQREYYLKYGNLSEKNITNANVYHTLCGYHDKVLFSDIENGKDYILNDKKQEFQYAYRSFIFNYSQQLIKNNYNLVHSTFEAISKINLDYLSQINQRFHSGFSNDNWEDIETTTIVFNNKTNFISSFYTRPIVTLNGFNMIGLENIAFNVFPQNEKTIILLSHHSDCNPRIKKYCREIERLSIKNPIKLQHYLTKLILVSDNNIAINPNYYYSLNEKMKREIIYYTLMFKEGGYNFWKPIMNVIKLRILRIKLNLFSVM